MIDAMAAQTELEVIHLHSCLYVTGQVLADFHDITQFLSRRIRQKMFAPDLPTGYGLLA
jgi:hypothetical protein